MKRSLSSDDVKSSSLRPATRRWRQRSGRSLSHPFQSMKFILLLNKTVPEVLAPSFIIKWGKKTKHLCHGLNFSSKREIKQNTEAPGMNRQMSTRVWQVKRSILTTDRPRQALCFLTNDEKETRSRKSN